MSLSPAESPEHTHQRTHSHKPTPYNICTAKLYLACTTDNERSHGDVQRLYGTKSCAFMHQRTAAAIRSFVRSFVCSFVRLFVRLFVCCLFVRCSLSFVVRRCSRHVLGWLVASSSSCLRHSMFLRRYRAFPNRGPFSLWQLVVAEQEVLGVRELNRRR